MVSRNHVIAREEKKHLKIWLCILTATEEGTSVYDALEKGLDDLMDLCDVVADKFTLARDAFAAEES